MSTANTNYAKRGPSARLLHQRGTLNRVAAKQLLPHTLASQGLSLTHGHCDWGLGCFITASRPHSSSSHVCILGALATFTVQPRAWHNRSKVSPLQTGMTCTYDAPNGWMGGCMHALYVGTHASTPSPFPQSRTCNVLS